MASRQESDINFFALVHHVLEANRPEVPQDRRDNGRKDYGCLQFIAPYRDGQLPAAADFEPVKCRDLSPTGFSYLANEPPQHEYVVVALGQAPFIFVSAAIRHHKLKAIDGSLAYHVGCKFIARINEPSFGRELGAALATSS